MGVEALFRSDSKVVCVEPECVSTAETGIVGVPLWVSGNVYTYIFIYLFILFYFILIFISFFPAEKELHVMTMRVEI